MPESKQMNNSQENIPLLELNSPTNKGPEYSNIGEAQEKKYLKIMF